MELLFGTHVREHGHRVGKLAGLELETTTRRLRKVIFSGDGELGNHALTRPFSAVHLAAGDLEVQPYTPAEEPPGERVLLSHSTRIIRAGREVGRLSGVELAAAGEVQAIVGRKNWWTRRFTISDSALDFSVPGEIRAGAATTRAA